MKRGLVLPCRTPPQKSVWRVVDANSVLVDTIEAFGHGGACAIMTERHGKKWIFKYRVAK
ncbi:MAG: hypothetical protein C5B50_00755 [Verrucomicrobia bacterium]|nr:MAG: hypothetical protein C5B50_00755 [Verrucomicrobiota bacterium]